MEVPIKILVVEDEMVIGANIAMQLTNLGYAVTGIIPRGEDAVVHVMENPPDLIVLDINLKGTIDGIETAVLMQKQVDIPIIYLTANADQAHFKRAKSTNPYAFISKPYKKLDLQRAIELAVNQMQKTNMAEEKATEEPSSFVLSDRIFVRHHEKLLKISIQDILYIEAERNYCRIHSKGKEYLLVITLKKMDQKLPKKHFLRVHRSYIVNLAQIDEVATSHLVIAKKAIPIGKTLKEELLKRLQMI